MELIGHSRDSLRSRPSPPGLAMSHGGSARIKNFDFKRKKIISKRILNQLSSKKKENKGKSSKKKYFQKEKS